MTDHKVDCVKKADRVEPNCACPDPGTQETEMCEGTLTGTINGTVQMECCCCCPKMMTRTFIINIGPQSEANLIAFLQNTVNSWENGGYMILGHSIADIGAGWLLGLTIGWYQP